mmetsp:Transcript_41663/g.82216  ORF Transcript_41663/g.82216 Transcript_41663/m.82216 type:complete len:116 (-) Transcript_41663:1170-1517(-)
MHSPVHQQTGSIPPSAFLVKAQTHSEAETGNQPSLSLSFPPRQERYSKGKHEPSKMEGKKKQHEELESENPPKPVVGLSYWWRIVCPVSEERGKERGHAVSEKKKILLPSAPLDL